MSYWISLAFVRAYTREIRGLYEYQHPEARFERELTALFAEAAFWNYFERSLRYWWSR